LRPNEPCSDTLADGHPVNYDGNGFTLVAKSASSAILLFSRRWRRSGFASLFKKFQPLISERPEFKNFLFYRPFYEWRFIL
jgi:hypothetical protein